MAANRYGKYTCMSLTVCIHTLHPLWKGRSGISPSWTCKLRLYMVQLRIAIAYIPNVIICKFRLCISMNYMENVAELLTHARTVDTKRSSLIFVKRLGMRLCSFKIFIQAKGSKSSRLCEDTSLAGRSKVWYTSTRGSHIHIAYRSICDQDQES